jgi:hypothetical protein
LYSLNIYIYQMIYLVVFLVLYMIINKKLFKFIKKECKKLNINLDYDINIYSFVKNKLLTA